MTEVKDVLADRDKKYGSFAAVAATTRKFRDITTATRFGMNDFDADQAEALHMIYMKIARILHGDPDYADNWIDIAGYATLVANRLGGVGATGEWEEATAHWPPGETFLVPDGWEFVKYLPKTGDHENVLIRRRKS